MRINKKLDVMIEIYAVADVKEETVDVWKIVLTFGKTDGGKVKWIGFTSN